MKPCRIRGCSQACVHDGLCLEHWRRLNRARSAAPMSVVATEDATEREAIVAESKMGPGENLGALGVTYGGEA